MITLYPNMNNSHDTEISKYIEVLQTVTNQLPVGMVLLRSDFRVLQYNTAAQKYVGRIIDSNKISCSSDPLHIISAYFINLFRSNGLLSLVPLNDGGICSVAMTPFVLSGNNGTANTYYSVCISENHETPRYDVCEAAKQFGLSARETEIVNLIIQGHSNQEIAKLLYISVHTVKTHNENIFKKLGIKNRASVVKKMETYSLQNSYAYG